MLGGPALSIGAGQLMACARYGAGAVRCWGRGADGLLGHANVNNIGDDERASAAGPVQLF